MSDEMAVYQADVPPLKAADIRAQVNTIQEVMKAVMQEGQHFGKIPGAGDKPTLLKPGAEKIMVTFRLAADPVVDDLSFNDVIRYRVKCLLTSPSGRMVGAGIGECSSEEEKYKWRGIVSDAEWNATPDNLRRIKYRRDREDKQIRTNPYDLANTILKMAKKRALVDAVLTATAASDIFTQDIEDMPEELLGSKNSQKPPIKQPQAKGAESADAPADSTSEPVISDAQAKRFYAIAKGAGWKDDNLLKEWLMVNYGIDSSKKISRSMYEEICETVKEGPGDADNVQS